MNTLSTTTNYNLHLCDDDTIKFKDWRNEINGTTDSNMIKIDTALSEKANKSNAVESTLRANAWIGANSPYTQEIAVSGLGTMQNGAIGVSHSASAEQRDAAREAMLSVVGQSANKLTISADGELPSVDIPVMIIIYG